MSTQSVKTVTIYIQMKSVQSETHRKISNALHVRHTVSLIKLWVITSGCVSCGNYFCWQLTATAAVM